MNIDKMDMQPLLEVDFGDRSDFYTPVEGYPDYQYRTIIKSKSITSRVTLREGGFYLNLARVPDSSLTEPVLNFKLKNISCEWLEKRNDSIKFELRQSSFSSFEEAFFHLNQLEILPVQVSLILFLGYWALKSKALIALKINGQLQIINMFNLQSTIY